MYILKCYCYKDSKSPNLFVAYSSKKAAEARKKKAIESGCYFNVELIKLEPAHKA